MFAFSDRRENGSRDFGEFPLLERNCRNVHNRTLKSILKSKTLFVISQARCSPKPNPLELIVNLSVNK